MGVSGIGGSGDMAATRKQLMERVFKKMDSDGNGSISKDELQKAADERKAATGNDAPTNLPSIDDFFKSADANGDGGISQDELLGQLSKMGPPPGKNDRTQGVRGDGSSSGARPPGGCGGSSSAAASDQADASTSPSKVASDPADTDGDGDVSATERRAYDYKQLMASLENLVKDTDNAAREQSTNEQSTKATESSCGVSVMA
jgi:EF-hand domain pair